MSVIILRSTAVILSAAIPPSGKITRNAGGHVTDNPSNSDEETDNNVNTVRGRFSSKKGLVL